MQKQESYPSFEELMLDNECFWGKLYKSLRPPATLFVHMYTTAAWVGQEYDLVDDIVQETVIRMHKQTQMVAPGEVPPIRSLEAFCHMVARNYCLDLRRKDRRLTRFPQDSYGFDTYTVGELEDPWETALDELATYAVISRAAQIIADFPPKQRTALLIDLARHADYTDEPSAIQRALAGVGIRLEDYRHKLPSTVVERNRHNALVSLAYKNLRATFHREYSEFVA